MRFIAVACAVLLIAAAVALSQQPPPRPAPPAEASPPLPPAPPSPPMSPDLGKWWKNSQVARDLQLNEGQIKNLGQIFLEQRQKLRELKIELDRQETLLQSQLDADQPDEKKIEEQTEQVLAVRGKLERANTSMMLSFRRVLSADQWKKLEEIRRARKNILPPPPPPPPPAPPAPPVPPTMKEVGTTASGEPLYAISGSIKPPAILEQRLPEYTPEAKEKKIEGIVLLQAVVGKDGLAHEVKVLQGIGHGLDEAAVDTVSKAWRFQPGTLDGKPVNVRAKIEISFRLY